MNITEPLFVVMIHRNYPTVCGMWCDDCDHFEEECQGCTEADGCIFWTEFVDAEVCPVYSCVQERGIAHCGFCDEMPCERYTRFRDPDMSEEELMESLRKQKEELTRRRIESQNE